MKNKSIRTKSDTDWRRLRSMKDDEIDFSDVPRIDPAAFKKMVIRMPRKKTAVSIRLDAGLIRWFKKRGRGYQTRINAVLHAYVEAHSR